MKIGTGQLTNQLPEGFGRKELLALLQVGQKVFGVPLDLAVSQNRFDRELKLLKAENAPPHFLADHSLHLGEFRVTCAHR
ncbi:hypothetical protein D9M68_926010 [compost metagenome]